MPATYTKLPLGLSNGGKQILISSTTSGSATPLHYAVSGSINLDEIYLYASAATTSSTTCSILWGGTNEPTDVNKFIISPLDSRVMICDGKLLQNSLVVSAYTSVANTVVIDGFVNRIQLSGSIDGRVLDWATNVVLNGGSYPSSSTMNALSAFVSGLDNTGLWSKMICINCFVPDSLTACLTPLLIGRGTGNIIWTNTGPFSSSDLTVNGLKGNGSKYLRTGLVGATVYSGHTNDAGFSTYEYTQNSNAEAAMGASPNGSIGNSCWTNIGGSILYDTWNNTTGRLNVVSLNNAGFTSCNRVSAADVRAYFGNSTSSFTQVGSTYTSIGNSPSDASNEYGAFCTWNGSAAFFISTKTVSFMAWHYGLTLTQAQSLFNLVTNLRISLGGGFV